MYKAGGWYSHKENAHKHLIFKNAFFERQDVIGLLFGVNKLCMAKVKYFRNNIEYFEPVKYGYKTGFAVVPLWDADFLRGYSRLIFYGRFRGAAQGHMDQEESVQHQSIK